MSKDKKLKRGTIAYHEAKIAEIRDNYYQNRGERPKKKKKKRKVSEDTKNVYKTKTKKPKPRYSSKIEYDFLKYIRVVFRWAVENNPTLNRSKIELLLYLYCLGAFSKKQFSDYHKIMGIYQEKTLDYFIDNHWVVLWRVRKGRQHALYTLTKKAKFMCSRMHKMACGVEEIPTTTANNMNRKDAPRINGYYLDIIKKMNKDKAPS